MKRYFLICLLSISAILMESKTAVAQKSSKASSHSSSSKSNSIFNADESATELRMSDVNMNAIRTFSKMFKNIATANWYKVEDGFFAKFSDSTAETKVAFDLTGGWRSTLRTYGEKSMSYEVRDIVKRKYYDYNILVVYEITHSDNVTCIIKIEDEKTLKTLRISDGEMELIADYIRG